jgi:DNA-binding transcriptional LysR family regulator
VSRLSDAEVFVSVVECASFSEAARRQGVSQPAISRRIAALEARLGTRLLQRTTRRFALSDAGRRYYERCRCALAELHGAEQEATDRASSPRGTLRVAAPPLFGRRVLVPRLPTFLERHPEIDVDLVLGEGYVDLVQDGVEVAIRLLHPGASPTLVIRRVGSFRMVACAAPSYLRRRRPPARPADLVSHACLVHWALPGGSEWPFHGPDGAQAVRVSGPLRVNDVEAVHAAALAGIGIAVLPSFAVANDLRSGALRPLLESFTLPPMTVWAVHTGRRHRSARLRVFLAWLATTMK